MVQDLFYVEHGTTDCKSIMHGSGYSTITNTGLTDVISYHSGALSKDEGNYHNTSMKYRYIEDLYGKGSLFIDKISFVPNSRNIEVETADGVKLANDIRANLVGMVKTLKYDKASGLVFPHTTDTNSGYDDDYTTSNSSRTTTFLYVGYSDTNYGLLNYVTAFTERDNSSAVYRLVRRPKK